MVGKGLSVLGERKFVDCKMFVFNVVGSLEASDGSFRVGTIWCFVVDLNTHWCVVCSSLHSDPVTVFLHLCPIGQVSKSSRSSIQLVLAGHEHSLTNLHVAAAGGPVAMWA